jgi:hydrogenase-4 component B
LGLLWLAGACVLLGLLPTLVIPQIGRVTLPLVNYAAPVPEHGWLLLAPVSPERASYAPLLVLLGIAGVLLVTFLIVRRLYHGRSRRAPAWDCGYPEQTPRMQDTAEGFGQPIKQIFEPFFRIRRHVPDGFDTQPYYHAITEDRLWHFIYAPVARAVQWVAGLVATLQHGRIYLYLLYSFATLIALLVFAR